MAKDIRYPFMAPSQNMAVKPIARMLAQPASVAVVGEGLDVLLRDYNQALVAQMGWMTRREVKKKDIIDIRPILDVQSTENWQAPTPKNELPDIEYALTDYWYCYVPCFQEGVLHVNSCRYIWWKVEDLDFERHRMAIWLQDFIYYDSGGGWQPGVRGLICWRFQDPEDRSEILGNGFPKRRVDFAAVPEKSITSYKEIYALVDVKQFHWPQEKMRLWKDVVLKTAEAGVKEMYKRTGMHNLDNLAGMFTSYMLKVNRILDANKKAVKSRPVSDQEHKEYLKEKKEAKNKNEKPAPERRIMNVGPIMITSRVKPKPGGRAVADYKKLAWKTRGHMRTLKSGKRVWVKESIHRRKALMTPENAGTMPECTDPVTIRIRSTEIKTDTEVKDHG